MDRHFLNGLGNGGPVVTEQQEKQQEQQRVNFVSGQIREQIETNRQLLEAAHRETRAVEQNYSDNASVNNYEADDTTDTIANIEEQRQLVARANESEMILKRQLDTMTNLAGSPYFGRIDIKDPGETTPESLYIGVASLMNDEKTEFLIYDWRAPISGVYYNGTLGTVHYPTPGGTQTTELTKKRQFTIRDGQITNMFDTNETVGDEMLQAALGQQNDQHMQNIVATIQKEQNDIIRDTTSDLLLVQGVAGSGKTSAILQRIAYLLYHSRASLNADQIVLFSPNRLFSHYISEVLPSLGERNMRQITLAEFLNRRFEGLDVQTLFQRFEDEQSQTEQQKAVQAVLESAASMQHVEQYCQSLTPNDIQFTNILFNGRVFFSADHILALYQQLPTNLHLADKILATKNALIKELKQRIKHEAKQAWIAEELDHLSDESMLALYGKHRPEEFDSEDAQIDYLSRRLAHRRLRIVYDAIYNNYFIDFYAQYGHFLQATPLAQQVTTDAWQTMMTAYRHGIEFHQIALMHCAPLLLLRDLITGSGQNRALEYVFIDEMQDYSVAALIYLKHVFVNAKFTILGDSEQALFKDIEAPQSLLHRLSEALAAKRPNLIALNRSYRSTTEITHFAKALLPDGDQITAFSRHGARPKVLIRYDHAGADEALLTETKRYQATYQTVAILTKNAQQAKDVFQRLHTQTELHLLQDTDRQLPGGLIVLPIYLAKGLEFDAVIAYDVSETNYHERRSIGILYTIASRAMHDLTLLSIGEVSSVITQIPSDLMQIEHRVSKK
jgi:DNA helicase IV